MENSYYYYSMSIWLYIHSLKLIPALHFGGGLIDHWSEAKWSLKVTVLQDRPCFLMTMLTQVLKFGDLIQIQIFYTQK